MTEKWQDPRYRRVNRILDEVSDETQKQVEKWGVQDHPLLNWAGQACEYAAMADQCRALFSEVNQAQENPGWDLILIEEVYEAFAEEDPDKARAELIQVAAVAVSAIENIDRAKAFLVQPGNMPLDNRSA